MRVTCVNKQSDPDEDLTQYQPDYLTIIPTNPDDDYWEGPYIRETR